MAKFKAIVRGYDNVKIREPGEEFEFDGKPAYWMELVEDELEKPKAKPKGQPKPAPSIESDVI